MKRLLILDSRTAPGLTLWVVQCLAATQRFSLAIASPHPKSSLRHSRWVDRFHPLSESGAEQTVSQLSALAAEYEYDLVLPVNLDEIDLLISPAAAPLRQQVALPHLPDANTFQTACSKYLLTAFMEKHGIAHPKTVRIDLDDPDAIARAEALPLPVIVKPTWGGGGSGIHIIRNPGELRPMLENDSTPENPLIVQAFIPGYDIGTAAYCEEGEVMALTMQRNTTIDRNSVKPSKGLRFMDDPSVRKIAQELLSALHWSGIAQIDLRVDETTGQMYVLEINPRFWGSVHGSQRMGVNFPALAVARALELEPPPQEYAPGKYITAWGYLLHWKDRLLGRKGVETYTCKESGLSELAADPRMTLSHIWQQTAGRLLPR